MWRRSAYCRVKSQFKRVSGLFWRYGWDNDNFESGNKQGIFEIQGIKIGIRICFEIRFPEYFRELYKERTDINIVLFYDVSDYENIQRYEMIKGHIESVSNYWEHVGIFWEVIEVGG